MEPDDVDKAKRWLKRMAEARLWNDDVRSQRFQAPVTLVEPVQQSELKKELQQLSTAEFAALRDASGPHYGDHLRRSG